MIQKSLKIGDKNVGDGYPCFIVAEIGSNHNQSLEQAKELIDAAAEAKVNAVKFQTFSAKNHYSKFTGGFSYLGYLDTYELIESLELNRSWHKPLQDYAHSQGVEFFSSPCDQKAVSELNDIEVPAFKVASFDLPDINLIHLIAGMGKPVILSTGMANWSDIRRGLNACSKAGNKQTILLQCTSLYPAPPELSNLRAIDTMRAKFGTLVGYSDHTLGDQICLAAVALGACMIEKHFTLDRSMVGPDHSFAMEPPEMVQMVKKIRDTEAALGSGEKNGPREKEKEMFEMGRRSIHARQDITAGEIITDEMLMVKRPGYGIAPHCKNDILGKKAKINIESDHWITWNMI